MDRFILAAPIRGRVKPGFDIALSAGEEITLRADGRYEARTHKVKSLSPPTLAFETVVFDIAHHDKRYLDEVQA